MSKDNGGCAFPNDGAWANGHPEGGMTLRDYFAAQALPICRDTLPGWDLTALFGKDRTGIRREEIIAAEAYRLADAMLARRKDGGA